jgi:hypothetical protein
MKILVIGHSVEDHIHFNDKEVINPGGIFYSVMGMTNFLDDNDEVFLITSLDRKNEHLFSKLYEGVNKENIQYTDKIPKVHLRHHGNEERCEQYENITDKLSLKMVGGYSQFDGILINMITGFDITSSDLAEIRSNYKGTIYLDIHTLSRGVGKNNHRYFRPIPDAGIWISSVDILQVNESELKTLADEKNEIEAARKVLSLGLKHLIVTKGESGVRIYWRNREEIESCFIPAIKVETKNKIGCGDIFGSVFFYFYLIENDFIKALKIANIAAGCSAAYSDIKEFKNLRNDTFTRLT